MDKDAFKQWESQQLLYLFVGIVVMLVIYTAVKITVAHYVLPVLPAEPFKYQAGYWKV